EYLTKRPGIGNHGGMANRTDKDALFDGFAEVAKALASGRRAEIADLLAQGERPVEEIAGELGQSVANTSHNLRAMARGGRRAAARGARGPGGRRAPRAVTGRASFTGWPAIGWPNCGRRCATWQPSTWPGWNTWLAPTSASATASRSWAARNWWPGWSAVRSWCSTCARRQNSRPGTSAGRGPRPS